MIALHAWIAQLRCCCRKMASSSLVTLDAIMPRAGRRIAVGLEYGCTR